MTTATALSADLSGWSGDLSETPLPRIFKRLSDERASGVLTLTSGVARKAVYFGVGRIVFAASNLPSDRLGEILMREGRITLEEYEASSRAITRTKRQGRVLVEMGALKPSELWEGVELQMREILRSVFSWQAGRFYFDASALAERERITVDIATEDAILSGIRRLDPARSIRNLIPADGALLQRVQEAPVPDLAVFEKHVLELVDGRRTVSRILQESDIGDGETTKVLYALICLGVVRAADEPSEVFDHDLAGAETTTSVAAPFNAMYRHIFDYMVREVGPIAENVLERYLAGLRESRGDVFGGVRLLKDGAVDAKVLERNLEAMPVDARRPVLVEGLNELLYAELLAVKRTLGPEHEARIVRNLRSE